MSQPAPIPGETHAAAGPFAGGGQLAPSEAAIASAKRRLLMATRLSDLALTVTEAVAERAVAEEAAAKAVALALLAAAEAGLDEEAPVASQATPLQSEPSRDAPAQDSPSQTALAGDPTPARAGSGAARRTPALRAADLFARLCNIVRQCLELEIRLEAELRRLQAYPFAIDEVDARQRDQMQDVGRDAPRNEVVATVETVVDERAKTPAGNPRTLRRAARSPRRRRRLQPPPRPG